METNIFIRSDNRFVKIRLSDILYVESRKNYIQIVTPAKSHMTLISMKQMEKSLPACTFCRIHRSFIVSLEHITSFDHENVYIGNVQLPLSEQYRAQLHSSVKILLSETRHSDMLKNKIPLSQVTIERLLGGGEDKGKGN